MVYEPLTSTGIPSTITLDAMTLDDDASSVKGAVLEGPAEPLEAVLDGLAEPLADQPSEPVTN